MTRALYLDAARPWTVQLDEGATLHMSTPGRARSLVPISRLARITCPAHARWDTASLLACLRAGVAVVFHDAAGQPVGWCFGPRQRETTLGNLLREAVGRPDGSALLQAWRDAAGRHEMLEAHRALGLPAIPGTAAQGRARLCNAHRLRRGEPAGSMLRTLQRGCAALVAERLHQTLGDASLIGYSSPGIHLGEWLLQLMEWRLHIVLGAMPVRSDMVEPGPAAARALEQHSTWLHGGCLELLGQLELHLREALS